MELGCKYEGEEVFEEEGYVLQHLGIIYAKVGLGWLKGVGMVEMGNGECLIILEQLSNNRDSQQQNKACLREPPTLVGFKWA